MRIPLSWLGEWVDLPERVTPEGVQDSLVRVGLEEEGVHDFGLSGPIVAGEVVSVQAEPQKNGKTINWCQVDVGEENPRGIVCGAHNFVAGDKVVVTIPGAILPGPFPISARKTYGHISDGMIASARELGLGDDHEGILRLADLGLDPSPGTDLIGLLGLADTAIEVNVTPDRGYALSIRGIAREYAHATGANFRDPANSIGLSEYSGYPVRISDERPVRGRNGCQVFVARIVRGVDPGRPTPAWMAARLRLSGVRPVSIVVDIANYVMLELGAPIHTYDLDRVDAAGLIVRRANPGEKLTTLDGQERELDTEDLVVADGRGVLGLAGVMGGAFSEITLKTRDVLVEAAIWEPVSVARTARRHRLPSEAAKRYERGVDPLLPPFAAEKVLQLLVEFAGGQLDAQGAHYQETEEPTPIRLERGFPEAVMGVPYSVQEITESLLMIGAELSQEGDFFVVIPPSWRPDLVDQVSLVEEIARITGYHRIESRLPSAPSGRGYTFSQTARRRVALTLAAQGLTEVLAYPFVSVADLERYTPKRDAVRLQNPLDPSLPLLRRTLLPGLVGIARRNMSRGLSDIAIYEVGNVFLPEANTHYGTDTVPLGATRPDKETLDRLTASIPPQGERVAGLFIGDLPPAGPSQAATSSGIISALDAVRGVGLALGVDIRHVQGGHPALHPGRCAELRVGELSIGFAGELLPSIALAADLPRVVAVFELELDALIGLIPARLAKPLGTRPAATQDLSVLVADSVPAGQVQESIAEGAGELLEQIRLVDVYRGQGMARGEKSLTFALRFRALDRTLTAAEASEAKLAGLALATYQHGAKLRE